MFEENVFDFTPITNWKCIAETKERLVKIIVDKISCDIRMKIEKYTHECNLVDRTSTELFGYDRRKPSFKLLKKEISEFLNELVKLDIIEGFNLNIEDPENPYSVIRVYINNGSKTKGFESSIYIPTWNY